ncbi:flap endonuclease [Actinomadura graeca]|uniref:5'-3' exonuclease n=1 Tax=Actinomadura graeca TaxID=2750812 RepID=A0ABX8QMC0_9ACTN|nr:5'-3' exonuclease [Actinomadura graeca]QXJ19865.1 flap endonuclease [Actinomadura graeca]
MSGLMLLDTPSLYFRAFFGVPESVTAPDGTPVNAVRGLVDMIARLVQDRSPGRLVCCMDADWRPEFRVAALPSYKAHRVAADGGDQTPDALEAQLPVIDAVLDAFGLARAGVAGYEADDVIGTLAVRGAADGPVDIVTGDRDLFQLVDDGGPVAVLYTARGIRNLQVMGEKEVAAKYGIPGRGYGDYATLRGDPSDGLPGVPGVGDKTAAALVSRFGSVEGILAALDAGTDEGFPAGARRRMEAAREYLAAAETVVRVVTDIDAPELAALDDRLPAAPRDPEALVELAERWNLDGPVNRLLNALAR